MIKVTFESTENDHKREFACTFDDGVTWTTILELGVFPGLRAMTYSVPPVEKVLDSICELEW